MKFSIVLPVHNGERFIRSTLESLRSQAYKDFEVLVFDNNSSDRTRDIVLKEFPEFKLIWHHENLGVWACHNIVLEKVSGDAYIVLTDVILDKDFLHNAAKVLEANDQIGAIQAKVHQMKFKNSEEYTKLDTIDTLGFQIYRSRKITNVGHGEKDREEYNQEMEIFAVEGVVPIFRRKAIEDAKVFGYFVDPVFKLRNVGFNYGDDLDVSWRIRMMGWKQIMAPNVIAWHDRSTTSSVSKGGLDYLKRVSMRRQIPIMKRRLDWSNVRFTILKNDYTINILRDILYILPREIAVLGYAVIFEPGILKEIPRFFRCLPQILRQRREIMKKTKIKPEEMRHWIK